METRQSSAIGSSERGYTLIELLVVLAVIGLMLLAVPVLVSAGRPGAQARSAAEQFAGDLRAARMAAILNNAETKIVIDQAAGTYAIQPGGRVRNLAPGLSLAVVRPDSARQGASVSLSFYPDGSSSGGVVRISSGRQQHIVTDHQLTGRVAIDE